MRRVDLERLLDSGGKDPGRPAFGDDLTGLYNRGFLFCFF